jgi:hypothetical protein
MLRRMLDAGGCTKGENFDIHDFARVRLPKPKTPAPITVTKNTVLTTVTETQPKALREESWRDGVHQTLYPRAAAPLPMVGTPEPFGGRSTECQCERTKRK